MSDEPDRQFLTVVVAKSAIHALHTYGEEALIKCVMKKPWAIGATIIFELLNGGGTQILDALYKENNGLRAYEEALVLQAIESAITVGALSAVTVRIRRRQCAALLRGSRGQVITKTPH